MKALLLMFLSLNAVAKPQEPPPDRWRSADFITTGLFEHCAAQLKELFNKGDRLGSVRVNSSPSFEWNVLEVESNAGSKAYLRIYSWVNSFRTYYDCGKVSEGNAD